MKRRTFLYNFLLLLPVLFLMAWWTGVQVYLLSLPYPQWVLAARIGISDSDLSGANLGGAQAVPENVDLEVIPPRRAALISWQMLKDTTGYSVTLNAGPTLMVVTFPDGQARLAWRSIALVSISPDGLSASAAAAYLDATNGTPLAVIQNISVTGSDIAALAAPAESSIWVLIMRNLPLILLGAYLMVIALVLLAASLIHRLTRHEPAPAKQRPPQAS